MKGRGKRAFRFETLECRFALAGAPIGPSDSIDESTLCDAGCYSYAQEAARQVELTNHEDLLLSTVNETALLTHRNDTAFDDWLNVHQRYLPYAIQSRMEPEVLLLAQRSMFLQADTKISQLGMTLYDAISETPFKYYWGSSGEATNFLESAFDAFRIPGQFRKVQLWHTEIDHSMAIEYYSNTFAKGVFYDPLYGVVLLDESGIPAGLHELFSQLIEFGRDFEQWQYLPVRIDGLLNAIPYHNSDPEFQYYLNRDYESILLHYTSLISFAEIATTNPPTFHTTVLHAVDPQASESSTSIARNALTYFASEPNASHHASVYRMEIQQPTEGSNSGVPANIRLINFARLITETTPGDERKSALKSWISHHLSEEEIQLEADPVMQILIAYRRMSRSASEHEISGTALLTKILADPNYKGWGHAGVSVDFTLAALAILKIQAFKVQLWHTSDDTHTLLGFYDSNRISQLADPLYGRRLIDVNGNWVGLSYLQSDISRLRSPEHKINLLSQKIDSTETGNELAVDTKFQHFISNDWTRQASYYLNLLVVEFETRLAAPSTFQKKSWALEQVNLTRSPSDREKHELLTSFTRQHSYLHETYRSVNFLNRYDPEQYLSYPSFTQSRIADSAVSLIQRMKSSDSPGDTNAGWVDQWLIAHSGNNAPEISSLAERVLAASRNMFLTAHRNEREVGVDLSHYLQANPQESLWAQCGSTVDFLMKVFRHYGIPARRIQMWHALDDHHVALEYFSQASGKFVFYDPLYSRLLLSAEGVPASFEEISLEAQRAGTQFEKWILQPVMFGGGNWQEPADERLSQFLNHDYSRILKYYLNITAVEFESTTDGVRPSEWAEYVSATWAVTMRPEYSDLRSLPNAGSIFVQFRDAYSATAHGRFYITEYMPVDGELVLQTPVFPSDLWNRFVNRCNNQYGTLQNRLALLRSWLDIYQPRWLDESGVNNIDSFALTFLHLVTRDRHVADQAILQLSSLIGGATPEESLLNLDRDRQFIWFLKQLNSDAHLILLADNRGEPVSLVEYTSPGLRRQTLVNVASNQMYVDRTGLAASITDLTIEYKRSQNQEVIPRYMPLNLAMLDPLQRSNPWLIAAARRATPGQYTAVRRGTKFVLCDHSSGVLQASTQIWTLRHLPEAQDISPLDSQWLTNQGRRLLAWKYGAVDPSDSRIAPLVAIES